MEDEVPRLRALRVSFECGWSGPACKMSFAGSKEAVLSAAIAHERRDHGDVRSEEDLRKAVEALLREESIGWMWSVSATDADRPARPGRSPG
jgi:hypothetical protein